MHPHASSIQPLTSQEEISLEEAVEVCVLPAHRLLRADGEASRLAEVGAYITEVGTYIPRPSPSPRGLPPEASEADRLESLESRRRGAALYAPTRATAAAPPPEACVARSAAEEELVRQRRRADAMARSYTQPGHAADGLRLQARTTTTTTTTNAPALAPAQALAQA